MKKDGDNQMQPLAVSVGQTTAMLGLSQATLYRMMDRGELDYAKVGGRRLVKMSSIKRLLGEA